MLENYLLYLGYITQKIQKFFEEQKEYIYCSKGCAKCCKKAQFPYSEIEFKLIFEGLKALEPNIRQTVLDKVDNIIRDKQKHNEENPDKKFRYDCPFLINDICTVYYYRGLVCRTFGVMTFKPNTDEIPKIPFCAYEGLNYSKVIDAVNNKISDEKYQKECFKQEPKAYNIDYETLISEEVAKGFGFEFGEVKPLIEWFIKWKEQAIKMLDDNSEDK